MPPAGSASAALSCFAYLGLLLGPVLIGGVAHLANLRIGLALVALTMGWIALVGARSARRYLPARAGTPAVQAAAER